MHWVLEKAHVEYLMDLYSEVPNRRADRNKQAGLEKSATY